MIEFLHYLLNLLKILLGIGLQAKEITYGNWLLWLLVHYNFIGWLSHSGLCYKTYRVHEILTIIISKPTNDQKVNKILSQATQRNIFILRISCAAPPQKADLRTGHTDTDRGRKRMRNKQHQQDWKPAFSWSQDVHSTSFLQPLPTKK